MELWQLNILENTNKSRTIDFIVLLDPQRQFDGYP